MKIIPAIKLGITLSGMPALMGPSARADTFGSGANTFDIDFVTVGNACNGNGPDVGLGTVRGAVAYEYRIAVTEVPQDWIEKARSLGLTNSGQYGHTGHKPATQLNWYQMAEFANWLNTRTGHHAAYDLIHTGYGAGGVRTFTMNLWSNTEAWQVGGENRYRHKDAYYFLPNENEWNKAAYHKNDGVTANYWAYATASDTIPTAVSSGTAAGTAVYRSSGLDLIDPAAVDNNGGVSAYGTRGQNGNVHEWLETAFDRVNDSATKNRVFTGGSYQGTEGHIHPSFDQPPTNMYGEVGFRVASITDDLDGDGLLDQYETGTGIYVSATNTGTNPLNPDSDGDGLTDGQEADAYHSNPNIPDTDGDGFEDGFEVSTGFSPTSATSTPDAVSSILTAVEYRFNAASGSSYRIEGSTDLANWFTIETNIIGSGGVITRFYSVNGQLKRYFRSRRN